MKKRFLIATLVAIFSFSCGNKNEETQQQDAMQEVAWIFRCKGRHDSDTKYATHSATKVATIPLERSPLIPEQSTPLYS